MGKIASFLSILCLGLVAGCAVGQVLPEVNEHLSVVTTMVTKNMPQGVRSTSPNGRELLSNYFPPSGKFNEDALAKRERAYAHVFILGSSRPYKLEVRVVVERRVGRAGNEYERLGYDLRLAKELLNKIERDLASRREDRNLLDDFRVF